MHLALYRSERPECFEDIIGQKHIVKILQNQVRNDSVSQAYLFTGTRGTGKTSTARILAKAVNCTGEDRPCGKCDNCRSIKEGSFLDVIELDAASNNGVEDLRSLIDSVRYPPTVGRYKVYIIDEVHMLSQSAENAFLKTLEEPPEYAIFILATTDPEKVRATIKSRCMTLNFKRVSENDLVSGMRRICDKKSINIDDDALRIVATKADGSVRDALSILEQCISTGDPKVTKELVLDYIGSAGDDFYLALTEAVRDGDMASAITGIDDMIKDGKDAKQMLSDWLVHYRDLMVVKYIADPARILNASVENSERIKAQAETLDIRDIERTVKMLSEYVNLGRYSTQPRMLLETAAVQIMRGEDLSTENVKKKSQKRATDHGERKDPPREQRKPSVDIPKKQEEKAVVKEDKVGKLEHVEEEHVDVQSATHMQTGDADLGEMWDQIVDAVGAEDLSFKAMVGNNSRITGFENGEVTITVKKNKLVLAESSRAKIDRAVKKLFGEQSFVTLKGGKLTDALTGSGKSGGAKDGAGSADAEAVARDVSKILGGLEVNIID